MKQGDEIVIDGVLPAIVRAIRGRAELGEIAPLLSVALDRRVRGRDVIRAAIVSVAGERYPGILIETVSGWRTVDGEPVAVALRSEALPC
jgi:hypothetical protein